MKLFTLLVLVLLPLTAFARLGETEAELVNRFGPPTLRSNHSIHAQGKSIRLGPVLHFRQSDWSIRCDMIDGRCVRISYSKSGEWSGDQIALVLNSNGQGAKWTETSKASIAKLERSWRRSDGSTATWNRGGGMSLVWDAYNKAKAAAEERARVEARKKPKI